MFRYILTKNELRTTKAFWFEEWSVSDTVNGDVAKTGEELSKHG